MSYGPGMPLPDHPVIRNLERTGWPDGKEPRMPRCPVCGAEEPYEIYVRGHETQGCDACLSRTEAPWPDGGPEPACPVCGKPCEDRYLDRDGDAAGCDGCITIKDPWDVPECFEEPERPWE